MIEAEKLAPEFASAEYIEELVAHIRGQATSPSLGFPDILRKLLSSYDQQHLKIYYDGEDGIFQELSQALCSLNIAGSDDSANRDLAIEIVRFLICYPDNYQYSNTTTSYFMKKLLVGWNQIQETVSAVLTKDAGLYGASWAQVQEELRKEIFKLSQKVHLFVNIVGETILAISELELTTDELLEIIHTTDLDSKGSERIYSRIQNAVKKGNPVQLYLAPEFCRNHRNVKEFRFMAARGKAGGRNKGRVFLQEELNKIFVPIATPTHKYNDQMIRERIAWLLENHHDHVTVLAVQSAA